MKKILITGVNSYIGDSFEQWVSQQSNQYYIQKISLKDPSWKEINFSEYDVVLHVAGIAHNSTKKDLKDLKDLYYKINTDLTYECAIKAKNEGVKQFIFLSSMIVYGSKHPKISQTTPTQPDNFYGDSKLQAENRILPLGDKNFKILIVRPPMVYGPKSKGNYPKLAKMATKIKFYPRINNCRSMIYIYNLCEFIRLGIDNELTGIYHPQNAKYTNVCEMVKLISEVHGNRLLLIRLLNPFIKLFKPTIYYKKIFGDLFYDESLQISTLNYQVILFEESIKITESTHREDN